ncbi:MAG TPA: IclR family transcriptional regulator [Accumulibacter sp.]|nr:IclR family transcriptional regulator [Accumulibacter sp.]
MSILVSASAVLHCFSEDCAEVTVSDLVRRLALPKSTASRLLHSMRNAGLLETVGATKRYRPSLMLMNVGRTYRRSSTLIERADEVVRRVSQRYGHTGYVSKRDGAHIVAVTDHQGTNALRVVSSVGRILPAFASATGRSLLARLSDDEVRALYRNGLPPAPSVQAPATIEALLDRLADIRANGFATSHDEANRGVAAIAVAVGDSDTGEEVSLCIVLPVTTSDPVERAEITTALHEGAAQIAAFGRDAKFVLPQGHDGKGRTP